MKKGFLFAGLMLLCIACYSINPVSDTKVKVFSSPGSYDITQKWAEQYNSVKGGNIIEVVRLSPEEKSPGGSIFFVSGKESGKFSMEESWKITVAREVVVPVISRENPLINDILDKGVAPSKLSMLAKDGNSTWGKLLGNERQAPVRLFIISDERIPVSLSDFLGLDFKDISGKTVTSSRELFTEMRKDPSVIGFCKLGDILDPATQDIIKDVAIMPLDRDGNGSIDHTENIYSDYNTFTRGVWIGKYPHTLVNNIYSCASSQPEDAEAKAFLAWVLDGGQKLNIDNGYTDLLAYESQANTEKLLVPVISPAEQGNNSSIFRSLLIVSAILVLLGFLLDFVVRISKKPVKETTSPLMNRVLDGAAVEIPAGLSYDKTHTWAFMEHDGFVRVGIDESLHHITGEITKIKMKSPGDKVKKGEEIMSVIRNGKQLNLYAPVSGTIQRKNHLLESDISLLNKCPYTDGWVYTLVPENWSRESQMLLVGERYRQFLKGEISRLKDFLAAMMPADSKFATVVLQDGGALADSPLAEMDPVVWEEFQTKFIDQSRQVWFYELF